MSNTNGKGGKKKKGKEKKKSLHHNYYCSKHKLVPFSIYRVHQKRKIAKTKQIDFDNEKSSK